MTERHSVELIGYQTWSLTKCSCTVLIAKHQSIKSVWGFSRIPIGFRFIDLSSSSINKIGNLLRSEAATREVFDLTKIPHTLLFLIVQLTFWPNFRKSVNSTYPINSFEEEAFCGNRSASFRLQKIYKHFTPSLRIISTRSSHCEPPANYIIEPLTFTASKMALRGKAIVFQPRSLYNS